MDDYAARLRDNNIRYDVADVDQQLSEAALLEIIDRYDGVLAGDDMFTRAVLEEAERLKVIAKWGIGVDNIDQDAAEELNVAVLNTPAAFGAEVADVVVGYAIMLTRKLHLIDRAVRRGDWYCPRGTSLAGKTLGVIGVGDIGSSVARRGDALGMDLVGNDVREFPDDLKRAVDIERAEKNELLGRSDVVSLNCALTDATRRLIGSPELDLLGPDGYLINTARGGLIDEPALIEALAEERIAGAALDVYDREPLPADSPLGELDNVILGSHNAQNTHEAVARVNDRAIENLIDGLTSCR